MPADRTIIAAIIGATITIIGTAYFSFRQYFLIRRDNAKAALDEAFAPTMTYLSAYRLRPYATETAKSIDTFLDNALLKQSSAIKKFEPFISAKNKEEYQKAWSDYEHIIHRKFSSTVWDGLFDDSGNKQDYISKVEDLIHKITSLANCPK